MSVAEKARRMVVGGDEGHGESRFPVRVAALPSSARGSGARERLDRKLARKGIGEPGSAFELRGQIKRMRGKVVAVPDDFVESFGHVSHAQTFQGPEPDGGIRGAGLMAARAGGQQQFGPKLWGQGMPLQLAFAVTERFLIAAFRPVGAREAEV